MSLSTFSFSEIYQRFFQYIDDSTKDIDLPTQNDNIKKHGYCSGNYYWNIAYRMYILNSTIISCNAQVARPTQRQLALLIIMYLLLLDVDR